MTDFVTMFINIIGPYTPIAGRNGLDAIDYPWIIAGLAMLIGIWFLCRLIINFVSSCCK